MTGNHFFDRLYFGLGYEYYTASILWMNGYEAFKMDADFGFDILAYNQKEQTINNKAFEPPYLFQVKSRRIQSENFAFTNSDAGIRRVISVDFEFKKEDIERLVKEKNSFIVCYFVEVKENDMGLIEEIIGSFWLNNDDINYLYEGNNPSSDKKWIWFHQKGNDNSKLILRAQLTTKADSKNKVNDFISNHELIISNQIINNPFITDEIKGPIKQSFDQIKSWIDRSKIENDRSRDYISLIAQNSLGNDSYRKLSDKKLNLIFFRENQVRLFD